MSVVGHGIDLVEVARIAQMIEEHGERFLQRVFTEGERAYAEASRRRLEHLAARFAAKEAVLKAIGTGWRHGIAWTDVEITNDGQGRPEVTLHGQALKYARDAGISRWLISLSHTDSHAIASAIGQNEAE